MRVNSCSGMGLTILVALIAVLGLVLMGSVRTLENMSRQTQLRIDQTKAHYLAQAGVMRAVWKWYTNNDTTTTNEVARRWSPINTTVVGNNIFKAGSDSAGAYLQSNYAYVVPGIALVKNVVTAASNTASTTTLASAAIGTTVPVGNYLVIYVALDALGISPTGLDSKGNVYSARGIATGCANATANTVARVAILSGLVNTALTATDTITVNWTTAVTAKAFTVVEFSGVDSFDATLNAWACNSVANAAPSANPTVTMTASTGFANELIIGAIGVEGSVADAFTAGTNYLQTPPTMTGIGATTTGCLIRPEYRLVNAAAAYTANGTITSRDWAALVVGFYAPNRWFTSGANRRLQQWQIYNTHNASSITLDKVKISWTPAGAELLNDFALNVGGVAVSKWPGGTAASGSTIDLTDTVLASGATWQGANTYIQWNGAVNAGGSVTVTCQFIFSGDTGTSDAKTDEVVMWNGAQADGAGMPGDRVFTVTATGQVNQTTGRYFKVMKSVKATVSGAPATAAAPAVPVMEITDWDEEDQNIP